MRKMITTALFCALTACAPPAPPPSAPAESPPAPTQTATNPDAAALGAAISSGQWIFRGDAGYISTCYGAPESECAIAVQCEQPTGKITVLYSAEVVPDQATTLRIITASQNLDLAARSFNEGLPSVNAELASGDARLAALAASQDRFGVDVRGEINVFPWDETIARVIAACGS